MRASYESVVKRAAHIGAMTLLLAGCGIDQGGYRPPDTDIPDQAPQTMLVSGPIDAFGSVHVNGLVLDTSRAQIRIDGRSASQQDLALGQMIRAVAVVAATSATALSIDYEENVVGPVSAVDAAAGELVVLGQRVRVAPTTRFDGATLAGIADLAVGDRVAISGITAPANTVLATYVARAGAAEPLEITAAITAVGPAALTFGLGELTIDYSRVVLLDVPGGTPAANVIVEVTGSTLANGVLVADRVRALPLVPGTFTASATALTNVEVPATASTSSAQPTVARFVGIVGARSASSLTFGDLDVQLTTETIIARGGRADLVAGARVMVEGRILALGRVEATRIEIQ
jgi:hypothetical protein